MIVKEIAHRDLGSVEEGFAGDVRGFSLLLVARQEVKAALARAQEDADIEAGSILSQADEALVMG